MTHTRPQADPQEGTVSITDAVVQDLQDRRQMGMAKYGTELKAGNGRRPMVDLYQELLDAALYAKQVLIEQETEFIQSPDTLTVVSNLRGQVAVLKSMVRASEAVCSLVKSDLRQAAGLLTSLVEDPLSLELQAKARSLVARVVL